MKNKINQEFQNNQKNKRNLQREMNLHVPLTLEAMLELKYLASVPTQMITPQSSSPVVGLVQDSLLGMYLFTQGTLLSTQQMMRLIGWINSYSGKIPTPQLINGQLKWTSHQMMSMFLPEITYHKYSDKPNGSIIINGGQMTSGVLDKTTLGVKNNSLFHITWNDHGPLATRDFFDNIGFVSKEWLQMNGFSVGIADCVTTEEVLSHIKTLTAQAKIDAIKQIEIVNLGSHDKSSDPQVIKKNFPSQMITLLNKCRGQVEKLILEKLGKNNINDMVTGGSKGNKTNITQIEGMLGQQEVEGTWITEQYNRRTLPHCPKDSLTPEAHGFVENSFMSGLTPTEYWFHAQAGRIGIISKAIKTAETGYLQRKLVKALEDLRVCYDGTVRNANNIIIQTVYGNDGFDAVYHENQKLSFLNFNLLKMQKEFKHLPTDHLQQALTTEAYESYMDNPNRDAIMTEEFAKIMEYYNYLKTNVYPYSAPATVKCPINFQRLVLNMVNKFNLGKEYVADLDPTYVVQQVKLLRDKLEVDPSPRINYVSTIHLNALMATHLSSKNLIYNHKFTKTAFDHLLQMIYITFMRCLVSPGENVGIIAAQSVGEPTTQLTLDSFHSAGIGSKANVSRGVPRIRELLSLTKNPKTPSLTVQIQDGYFNAAADIKTNITKAEKLAAEIEFTTLEDLLIRTEIHYDEDDHQTCLDEDQEFIDSYYALLPDIEKSEELAKSPWLLRMEFNREEIMNKHIALNLIELRLNQFLEAEGIGHSVIMSDDNAFKMICRLKVESKKIPENQDPISFLRTLEKNLLSVKIKGINGIDKGIVRELQRDIVLSDGTIVSPFDADYGELSKIHPHLRFVIDTNGSNLIDVLNLPHIDKFNTVSNDVWEIYQSYGIEAARASLIHELVEVLEFHDTYVARRHLDLLVDVMTNQGILVSVDRHGVNKTDSGPLHRASFEETTTQLTNASIFNEVDQMTGVSGNIMFGQFIPTGTNAFRIALDVTKIKKLVPPEQNVPKLKSEISVIDGSQVTEACHPNNFQFSFKMNTKIV
jgi:DNA-directed RNA polymerase II subunit RPB1